MIVVYVVRGGCETRLAFKTGSTQLGLAFYWLSTLCSSLSGSFQFRVTDHKASTLIILRLVPP